MRISLFAPLFAAAVAAAIIGCGGSSSGNSAGSNSTSSGFVGSSTGSIDNGTTTNGTFVPPAAPGMITTVDLTPESVTGNASTSRITDFAVSSDVSVSGTVTTISLGQINLSDRYSRNLTLTLPEALVVGERFEFDTTKFTAAASGLYYEQVGIDDLPARYTTGTSGSVAVINRVGNDVTVQLSGVRFTPVSNDGIATGEFFLRGTIRFTLP